MPMPQRILVIELSNLGDCLLTLPALQRLREGYPGAEFHLLVSPRSLELFQGDPRIKEIWIWEKSAPLWKQLLLIGRLARSRFNLVVDFRHSLIPLFLPGARRTRLWRRPMNHVHRIEQHLSLVASLGLPETASDFPEGASLNQPASSLHGPASSLHGPASSLHGPANSLHGPAIWYGPEEKRFVREILKPDRIPVVMAPGARSHLKRWSAQGFAEVAERLILAQKAQVLLVGEEAEQPIAQAVLCAMREPATDLVGRTTIRQLAALLAKARLLITNDSACLHAAEALRVPVVAIFGPTDEAKYGPQNPDSVVVRRTLICAPCERALCPYGHECMRWIEAGEVYQAAVSLLRGSA